MAVWPLLDSSVVEQGGAIAATSLITTVTAGVAHTKGVWAELIAATDARFNEIIVHSGGALSATATITASMFDIGIGALASEVVVVPDVQCGALGVASRGGWRLPVNIPAGSRVAMRFQSAVAAKTLTAQAFAVGGGFSPADGAGRALTYGTSAATSAGTVCATPGAVNTKGGWTQLSAATAAKAQWALVTIQPAAATAVIANEGLVDIGVGAAAAEQTIISNIAFSMDTSERVAYAPMTYPVLIPEGSRLVCRTQGSSVNAASQPRVAVTLFG